MIADQAQGERMTVILIPKAADDLRQLHERTNMSRTDLANRAISLYAFFDAQQRAGYEMIARDTRTGAKRRVQLMDAPARRLAPDCTAQPIRRHAGSAQRRGRHRRQHPSPSRLRKPLQLTGLISQEVSSP